MRPALAPPRVLTAALVLAWALPAAAQTEEEPEDAAAFDDGSEGSDPPAADPPASDPPRPSAAPSSSDPSSTGPSSSGPSSTGPSSAGPSSAGPSSSPSSRASTGAGTTASSSAGATSGSGRSTGSARAGAATGAGTASGADTRWAHDRDQDDDDDDEEEEDGGDPYDFLWIEAFGGWSFVDLRAIQETNFYPEFVQLRGDGPMGGAALGFRIEFLSVGVRAAVAHYGDEFDVGTATGEVTLALPIPVVKPYLRAGFGLGWHGDSNYDAPMESQTTVFGWAFTGAVGLDIYFIDWFAIGAAVTVDVLNMSRQSIDDPMTAPGEIVFENAGDAIGAQLRGHVAISFHL